MTISVVLLLASLVAIVILQTINRVAGAASLFAWCGVATAYGLFAFDQGVELRMLGIEAKRWNFVAFMAIMAGYNLFVIFRVIRARRRGAVAADSDPDHD